MDPSLGLQPREIRQLQDLTGLKWDKKSNQEGFKDQDIANRICTTLSNALQLDEGVIDIKKVGTAWKISINDIKSFSQALRDTEILDMSRIINQMKGEVKSAHVVKAEKLLNELFQSTDPEKKQLQEKVIEEYFPHVHQRRHDYHLPMKIGLQQREDGIQLEIDGFMQMEKFNDARIASIIKRLTEEEEETTKLPEEKKEIPELGEKTERLLNAMADNVNLREGLKTIFRNAIIRNKPTERFTPDLVPEISSGAKFKLNYNTDNKSYDLTIIHGQNDKGKTISLNSEEMAEIHDALSEHPFLSYADRSAAETKMKQASTNTFLIRPSSQKNCLAITVKNRQNNIGNLLIEKKNVSGSTLYTLQNDKELKDCDLATIVETLKARGFTKL